MSAQRSVPSPTARRASLMFALGVLTVIVGAAAYTAGKRAGAVHDVLFAVPTEARKVAFVREAPCASGRCQSLWIGGTKEDAKQVAVLAAGEAAESIAWAKDGLRVGFVINGYQLRIFDGDSGQMVGQANLIEPSGVPSSRIARGVTFSENGAAVTFDDCPRNGSGCRSALVAVRR